jgi:hypothetical protein
MYYISRQESIGLSRIVKTMAQFVSKDPTAVEGSEWVVRTRREVKAFDFFPVYKVRNGKMRKTTSLVSVWNLDEF